MKRKLKLDTLAVDTFVVSPQAAGERGTVEANSIQPAPETMLCTYAPDQCSPTFGYSCGKPNTFCCD